MPQALSQRVSHSIMDEAELRSFIRESVKRHLEQGHTPAPRVSEVPFGRHPSHGLLPVASGRVAGGPCLIEPQVACEHCRFCQSYGH